MFAAASPTSLIIPFILSLNPPRFVEYAANAPAPSPMASIPAGPNNAASAGVAPDAAVPSPDIPVATPVSCAPFATVPIVARVLRREPPADTIGPKTMSNGPNAAAKIPTPAAAFLLPSSNPLNQSAKPLIAGTIEFWMYGIKSSFNIGRISSFRTGRNDSPISRAIEFISSRICLIF